MSSILNFVEKEKKNKLESVLSFVDILEAKFRSILEKVEYSVKERTNLIIEATKNINVSEIDAELKLKKVKKLNITFSEYKEILRTALNRVLK